VTIDEDAKLRKSSIGIILSPSPTLTSLDLNILLCTLNVFAALKATNIFTPCKPIDKVRDFYAGDKIEKNEMGWACGAYG